MVQGAWCTQGCVYRMEGTPERSTYSYCYFIFIDGETEIWGSMGAQSFTQIVQIRVLFYSWFSYFLDFEDGNTGISQAFSVQRVEEMNRDSCLNQ